MKLRQHEFILLALFVALTVSVVFAFGLPGSFVLDDVANIVENSGIRLQSLRPSAVADAAFSVQLGGTFRTLPTLTFALDHLRAGGLDPATFRATNIGIHVLTALVLVWMLRDLLIAARVAPTRAQWLAPALALTWALHPLQVSAVLYIVQRMQTMATLFVVLSLWAYIRARLAQIAGESGRKGLLLAGLAWVGALGCKEDAILVPAYLLILEVTLFRFHAASASVARTIRSGFIVATGIGVLLYLFVVVPNMWSWDSYPTRDFTTIERLLTQTRVLCMYLWQIVLPLPSNMPFFYDWLQPSRGMLSPWTTLSSLLFIIALLAAAYRARMVRPLFSLGVLLFFAGHLITSNVIGLELAFEHRNHLPLLGIVLAVADLVMVGGERLRMRALLLGVAGAVLILILAGATASRAQDWKSGFQLARTSTRLAPTSVRAWHFLCTEWYEAGGGQRRDNPNLEKAISACQRAADLQPASVASLTNVLVFKSLQGTASTADWNGYLTRLEQAPIDGETVTSMWTMISMARQGVDLNEGGVLAALDILYERAILPAAETASIGYFILTETGQPDRARPYFTRAVQISDDPEFSGQLIDYLRRAGQAQWADHMQFMMQAPE